MSRSRHEPPEGTPGVSVPLPAPGALELLQAFVNTVATRAQPEALSSPESLSRWLQRRGLISADVDISAPDLKVVLTVRSALRALLAAKDRGEFDGAAVTRLERSLGDLRYRMSFDDGGPVGFTVDESSASGALGAILVAFIEARATVDWPHFRLCAAAGCRRAFYDASRSRTGRWCTDRCGNRVRSAIYRRSKKRL